MKTQGKKIIGFISVGEQAQDLKKETPNNSCQTIHSFRSGEKTKIKQL
jgi:hypothetical protein